MESASSLLSEEQFQCSICLDVFTDPVTNPCGHNYCKVCITRHWDSTDVCKCPLCGETFHTRPQCSVNKVLTEMAVQIMRSKERRKPAKPDDVCCDVCTENKIKAVKTCLVCMASYCETHLDPHLRATALKRHKLTDPVKNLDDVMCRKHDRPLEMFCKTDLVCVCHFCTQSDHKSHRIVSLKEQHDGTKAELGKTEAEVQKMIGKIGLKIEEVKHTVELSKKDADREIADSVQVFAALSRCIERSQAALIDAIEEKQKTNEKQADGVIDELQREMIRLKKRSSHLKQLSLVEDPIQLLQNVKSISTPAPTKDWTRVSVQQSSHVGTLRTAVAQLEKTLSQETRKLLCDAELRRIQKYEVDVTLDPDTAHPDLILSEDGKQVSHGNVRKNLPDNNAKRFSKCINVLGKQSFASGRFYYEVRVTGKTPWMLGVARESINRKGDVVPSPKNGRWTIMLSGNGKFYALAATAAVLLPEREELQGVGVFVDYEDGLVCFYDVEARDHLYSYTGCTFTEKLFPFFSPCVNDGGRRSAPLIISPVNHTVSRQRRGGPVVKVVWSSCRSNQK